MSLFQPWQVLHLDISQGIPALTPIDNCGGFFLVFWWHYIPLGHREILFNELPLSAVALTNLIAREITPVVQDTLVELVNSEVSSGNLTSDRCLSLEQILALKQPLNKLLELQNSSSANNSVSVVICTRDRPQQLAQCLQSLLNLSEPPLEILVVDNAPSTDATRQLLKQFSQIKYILEPTPGLSAARNTGILHSKGDIIAFTDDDVLVHSHWITSLKQGFNNPQVMSVTGMVLPAALDTEARYKFQQMTKGFGSGYQKIAFDSQFFASKKTRGVPVWQVGAGANMAFRSKIFQLVGNFNEMLGAGAAGCSEDSELWYRILAEGWQCYYEPTAVVFHYHRSDLDSLQKQMYQYMRGHTAAILVQFARYSHWGNLRYLVISLPQYYSKRLIRRLFKGVLPGHITLKVEILGCFAGIKYYWQHKNYVREER